MTLKRWLLMGGVAAVVLCCRRRFEGELIDRDIPRPQFYNSAPIAFTVIDEATREPIAGVAVVAVWRNLWGLDASPAVVDFRVEEAVSDPRGRITIPRWGPRPRKMDSYLDRRDPEIYLLKPGYRFRYADNDGTSLPLGSGAVILLKPRPLAIGKQAAEFARSAEGFCRWNGSTLTLPRVTSAAEAARALAAAVPRQSNRKEMYNALIEQYWIAWADAWKQLPPDLQSQVEPPAPVRKLLQTSAASTS